LSPISITMSTGTRRTLSWVGSCLAILGVLFVGFRLHSYWLELDPTRVTLLGWVAIAALSFVYSAANFLLAIAWWHLLQFLGATATRIISIRIYGISQLAKYLPGNIFHLAGRQVLGMAENIAGWILIKSSIFELFLIAIAGSIFGWLALPLIWSGFHESAGLFLLVGNIIIVAFVLAYFIGQQTMWAFMWQILFLFTSGGIFVVLLNITSGFESLSATQSLTIGAAFIIAWLAGLVTPGAPAGIGIREFVLLFLLKSIVSDSELLLTILISRIVTVFGDIWFYLAVSSNMIIHKKFRKNSILKN
jgi:hypothetical protein